MEKQKEHHNLAVEFFLGIYILAIPFHRAVWKLPFSQEKIQPAEFFLGALALYCFFLVFYGRIKYWFSPLDIPVFLWLSANIISNAVVGFNGHLILETTKVLAVVLAYFSCRLLMTDAFLGKFIDIFLLSALITSLLALAGSLLSVFEIQTPWVAIMSTYPYIGRIGRTMAYTSTPNMLGSILMTALLLKLAQWLKKTTLKKNEIFALVVCMLAFIAAISKTILCFFIGFLTLLLLRPGEKIISSKFFAVSAMVALVLIYLIGSHFVFALTLTPRVHENMQQGHISRTIYKLGPLMAIETSYLTIKKSCWYVMKKSLPWGVGTRNFKEQVPMLKEIGVYNKETKAFDPHCTPFGTVTELGLLGGIVLLVFFGQIGRSLLLVQRNKPYTFHYINTGLIAIFVALLLEAWVTDIMNFRHYWFLLGILAYMVHQAEKYNIAPAK